MRESESEREREREREREQTLTAHHAALQIIDLDDELPESAGVLLWAVFALPNAAGEKKKKSTFDFVR